MIQILEENDFFIVVNKPAGVSVHNQSPSLVEYLNEHKKPLHFVSRLDQETSGLMMIAQKADLHLPLAEAMDAGAKHYRALLRSPWKKPEATQIWSWPLTDQAEGWKNPQGLTQNRKTCETKIKVERTNKYFTEITALLVTGRQHQIRKHSALAQHPIVGDKRYNETKYNEQIAKFYQSTRMHLHAEKIEFSFKNKKYEFLSHYNLDEFFQSAT